MRQRAAQYEAHAAELAPNVLDYRAELVLDGRTLARPCNYILARIVAPEGVALDPLKRPFVIVDPRAGHGPGIGGFKADSEIGVAMKAGHAAYFIGFLPAPEPGQTILDIATAEATFLETVIARHPDAEGQPCVIGNCQAGWAVMIVAALRPELFGPIIIAGAPLSYWAGVRGQNPMRYSGGLLGGSWLTALPATSVPASSTAPALVQNFENQNPANTLWTKQYNLCRKIDTEPERYLEFEKWWGGHVTLNAEEIAMDRRRALRRQPPRLRRHPHPRRHRHRPALHPLADRRLLLQGRQHHPAAAGARLDPRPLRRARTTSAPAARPSSTPSTRRSATSGSSSPPASPARNTTSSPPAST